MNDFIFKVKDVDGETVYKIEAKNYLSFLEQLGKFERHGKITCEVCNGTGEYDRVQYYEDGEDYITEICPVCGGEGVATPAEIYKLNK